MIELIELLKLNIPFVTEETRLLPEIRSNVKFIRREVRNRQIETKKIPILSTQRTRSGRQVAYTAFSLTQLPGRLFSPSET